MADEARVGKALLEFNQSKSKLDIARIDLVDALSELKKSTNVCRALQLLTTASDLEIMGDQKAAEVFREYAWATLTAAESGELRLRLQKQGVRHSLQKTFVSDPKLL